MHPGQSTAQSLQRAPCNTQATYNEQIRNGHAAHGMQHAQTCTMRHAPHRIRQSRSFLWISGTLMGICVLLVNRHEPVSVDASSLAFASSSAAAMGGRTCALCPVTPPQRDIVRNPGEPRSTQAQRSLSAMRRAAEHAPIAAMRSGLRHTGYPLHRKWESAVSGNRP